VKAEHEINLNTAKTYRRRFDQSDCIIVQRSRAIHQPTAAMAAIRWHRSNSGLVLDVVNALSLPNSKLSADATNFRC